MTDKKEAVRTEGLWKTYEHDGIEVHAVRDISLTIESGEFIALAGPSGSGKTTLLNLIGTLTRSTRGKIWIAGREVTDEPEGEHKRPYILGNRRVVPKVAPAFPINGNLALYYQIYNAAPDGGDADLNIGYHISRKRGTRFARPTVAPPMTGVKDLVQIYELALTGWPAGEYKIKVIVTDNRTGAFDEREVFFHIE